MQVTIVGAGRGIGYAVAKLFGQKGYKVGLIARREEQLAQLVADLQAQGIKSMYAVADAQDTEQLKEAYSSVFEAFGYPAMVLFNAYAYQQKKVFEFSIDDIGWAMRANAGAAFNLAREILPQFIIENRGKLFFTGGGLANTPNPSMLPLGMSKAALRNMVYALAQTVAGTNVHVATLTINGFINDTDKRYNASAIAEQYWTLFSQPPGEFKTEVTY